MFILLTVLLTILSDAALCHKAKSSRAQHTCNALEYVLTTYFAMHVMLTLNGQMFEQGYGEEVWFHPEIRLRIKSNVRYRNQSSCYWNSNKYRFNSFHLLNVTTMILFFNSFWRNQDVCVELDFHYHLEVLLQCIRTCVPLSM